MPPNRVIQGGDTTGGDTTGGDTTGGDTTGGDTTGGDTTGGDTTGGDTTGGIQLPPACTLSRPTTVLSAVALSTSITATTSSITTVTAMTTPTRSITASSVPLDVTCAGGVVTVSSNGVVNYDYYRIGPDGSAARPRARAKYVELEFEFPASPQSRRSRPTYQPKEPSRSWPMAFRSLVQTKRSGQRC